MLGIIAHLLQNSNLGALRVGVSPLSSEQTGPVPFMSQTCPSCQYGCISFPFFLFFSLKFLSKELHGVTDTKSSWGR